MLGIIHLCKPPKCFWRFLEPKHNQNKNHKGPPIIKATLPNVFESWMSIIESKHKSQRLPFIKANPLKCFWKLLGPKQVQNTNHKGFHSWTFEIELGCKIIFCAPLEYNVKKLSYLLHRDPCISRTYTTMVIQKLYK
jgi:hypothetical protein